MDEDNSLRTSRPCRTKALPAKLQGAGEPGAAAGNGQAQLRQPAAAALAATGGRRAAGGQRAASTQREPVRLAKAPVRAGSPRAHVTTSSPPSSLGTSLQQRSPVSCGSVGVEIDVENDTALTATGTGGQARVLETDAGAGTDSSSDGSNGVDADGGGVFSGEALEALLTACEGNGSKSPRSGRESGESSVVDARSNLARSDVVDSSDDSPPTNVNGKGKGKARTESVGGRRNPHQASAEKAKGKGYQPWALGFLQRACSYRDIPRMSQQKSKEAIAEALTARDKSMGRPTPFFDDLEAIVEGKPRKNSTDEAIPAEVVLALRATLTLVRVDRNSSTPFKFGPRENDVADLFAIMDAEDAVEAAAEGGGSSESGATGSCGGTAAGAGGGGAAGAGVRTAERKGPHCMMRLVGILVEDVVRPLLIDSQLQANRAQLDVSAVGSRSEVWQVASERFRDPDHEVRRVVDHEMVANCDPNVIHQPNISAEKLSKMWAGVKAKWNQPHANRRGTSGNNQPWVNFCQGDSDIFLVGEAIKKYPELDQVCNALLPEDVQREDDGTGAAAGKAGGAERRASAKREGERLHGMNRAGKKKAKKDERAQSVADATEKAVSSAIARMAPLLASMKPDTANGRPQTDDPERQVAEIVLADECMTAHENWSKELAEEEKKGEEGSVFRKKFMRERIESLEKRMAAMK